MTPPSSVTTAPAEASTEPAWTCSSYPCSGPVRQLLEKSCIKEPMLRQSQVSGSTASKCFLGTHLESSPSLVEPNLGARQEVIIGWVADSVPLTSGETQE